MDNGKTMTIKPDKGKNLSVAKNKLEKVFQKLQQNFTFRPKSQTQNMAENHIYRIRDSMTLK